jgi:hypothetical protein
MQMKVQDIRNIQDKEKKHEFHFVIARTIREHLKNLTVFKKPMSFSGIIAEILKILRPVIKGEHKWGEQRMSKYRYVSEDKDEKRDHVHTYLDEDVYRELKLIHQDLNFYSIGQIVRGFVDFFLELVKEHGDNVFKELKKIYKRWKEQANSDRLTLREYLRHIWRLLPFIEGGNGHLSFYDNSFTPFWIIRM